MPDRKKGPQGKVFEARISPEARERMDREYREEITRAMHGAMERVPLTGRCGVALERLNILCGKIGAPTLQTNELRRDFAQMMIEEALNGKRFDELYRQYYDRKLADLLAAGAKAQNDSLFSPVRSGGEVKPVFPRANEITDTFERFMQSFGENMRANGVRRTNDLPEYGGNDAKGVFEMQAAAHKTLIRDNVQAAYEHCSDRGRASVSQTCQAARRAVDNAFLYADAFPNPSSQRADINDPDVRAVAVKETANVIRGLQEAHGSRSWLWALRHPVNFMREFRTIRSLKRVMSERGGLTRAEVAQQLSAPKETYDQVSKNYDEIYDRYSERKLAEAEGELAEERAQRERQRKVESAVAHSRERMREDGLEKDEIDARGRAEVEADMDLLNALEEIDNQSRSRSEESEPQSEEEKEPILINEEEPSEEKSDPIAESDGISAPQIERK